MRIKKIIFISILFLAILLRFYRLGEVPLSLDWDEVSNGYNAYSILKTANDEYGSFLPLVNRSFDDYKPPLYMYLNVPAVAVFGLNEFAVRFPSAVLGVLSVVLIFYLSKILFKDLKIAQVSMFMLAIAPWHIQFSRIGFEANSGIFMVLLSYTLLLWGLLGKNRKNPLLLLSAVAFGLSFYSYHAIRIFSPLLFIATFLIYKEEFQKIPRKILISFFLIIFILVVPFFVFTPKEAFLGRYQSTSLESRTKDLDNSVKFIKQDEQNNLPFSNIIHNRRIVISLSLLKNYLSHFDFNYLFTSGDDNLRHHTNRMGMLFFFQLPLILTGIYILIRFKGRHTLFILSWLLISPVAASPTGAVPHAVRSYTMVVAFSLISAYSINWFSNFKFSKAINLLLFATIAFSLFSYLHNYYSHYSKESASWWQYGYKEAVLESEKLKDSYQKVIVDKSIEQAYAFWLFYTKFDPQTYQEKYSKINFGNYYFENSQTKDSFLLVSLAQNFPAEMKILKTIYYPNGDEAIKIGSPK